MVSWLLLGAVWLHVHVTAGDLAAVGFGICHGRLEWQPHLTRNDVHRLLAFTHVCGSHCDGEREKGEVDAVERERLKAYFWQKSWL